VRADNGEVECWGQYNFDSFVLTSTPRVIPLGGATVVDLSVTPTPCALTATGELWCWDETEQPVSVDLNGYTLAQLARGSGGHAGHACAITTGQRVVCWGANAGGQCGQDWNAAPTVSTPRVVR
jgi:hypothetical protein